MNNRINILYIKELAEQISTNQRQIRNIYDLKLKKVIDENQKLITKNIFAYNNCTNKIYSLVKEIENNLSLLYKLLLTEVITGYEETAQSINKNFNISFQDQMNDILKEINK